MLIIEAGVIICAWNVFMLFVWNLGGRCVFLWYVLDCAVRASMGSVYKPKPIPERAANVNLYKVSGFKPSTAYEPAGSKVTWFCKRKTNYIAQMLLIMIFVLLKDQLRQNCFYRMSLAWTCLGFKASFKPFYDAYDFSFDTLLLLFLCTLCSAVINTISKTFWDS